MRVKLHRYVDGVMRLIKEHAEENNTDEVLHHKIDNSLTSEPIQHLPADRCLLLMHTPEQLLTINSGIKCETVTRHTSVEAEYI